MPVPHLRPVPAATAAMMTTRAATARMQLHFSPAAILARRSPITKRTTRAFCLWRRRHPRAKVFLHQQRQPEAWQWRHARDGHGGDVFGYPEAGSVSRGAKDPVGSGRVIDVEKAAARSAGETAPAEENGYNQAERQKGGVGHRSCQAGRDEFWNWRLREWRRRLREDPYEALFGAQNSMLAGKGWGNWAEAWSARWQEHLESLARENNKPVHKTENDKGWKWPATAPVASGSKFQSTETIESRTRPSQATGTKEDIPGKIAREIDYVYDPISGKMIPKEGGQGLEARAGKQATQDGVFGSLVEKYNGWNQDVTPQSNSRNVPENEGRLSNKPETDGPASASKPAEREAPQSIPQQQSNVDLRGQWLMRGRRISEQNKAADLDKSRQDRVETPEKGKKPATNAGPNNSNSFLGKVINLPENDIDLLRSSDVRAGMGKVKGEPMKSSNQKDQERQRLEADFAKNQEKEKTEERFGKPTMQSYRVNSSRPISISSEFDPWNIGWTGPTASSSVTRDRAKPVPGSVDGPQKVSGTGSTSGSAGTQFHPHESRQTLIETAIARISHAPTAEERVRRLKVLLRFAERPVSQPAPRPDFSGSVKLLQRALGEAVAESRSSKHDTSVSHSDGVTRVQSQTKASAAPESLEQRAPGKAARLLADEVEAHKKAMADADSRKIPSRQSADYVLDFGGLEGGYDAGESDAETLLANAKTALFKVEKEVTDADAVLQKHRDRKLVQDIKTIYETQYGPIDVERAPMTSKASPVDRGAEATTTMNELAPIPRVQSDDFRSLEAARRSLEEVERAEAERNGLGRGESSGAFGQSDHFGRSGEEAAVVTSQQQHHRQQHREETTATTTKSSPQSNEPQATLLPTQQSNSTNHLPEPVYSYKFLAYDTLSEEVTVTESTSAGAPGEASMPVSRALARLSNPAKFLPHLSATLETHEAIASANNLLVLREISKSPSTHLHQQASLHHSSSGSRDSKGGLDKKRSLKINPVDGTTGWTMPLPEAPVANFASPTGFVSYATPTRVKRPPPPPAPSATAVSHQQQPFWVTKAAAASPTAAEAEGKKTEQQSQKKKDAEATEDGGKGKRGDGGSAAKVMQTAIWATAACYVAGVVGEVLK